MRQVCTQRIDEFLRVNRLFLKLIFYSLDHDRVSMTDTVNAKSTKHVEAFFAVNVAENGALILPLDED